MYSLYPHAAQRQVENLTNLYKKKNNKSYDIRLGQRGALNSDSISPNMAS